MEYTQITLDEWKQMKQKLKQELLGVKHSFVRIGFALRKIEEQRLYEQDGYKSIAEFAKAEYGLEASTTSRFISINKEYSIDGYSEQLRPEYDELGRSQLEEMLKLPESDRAMIEPVTSREDIRELKRFNKSNPEAGEADDIHQVVERFYHDNKDVLNAVFGSDTFRNENGYAEENVKEFAEIINPAGNRSYKKGMFFLMMYESKVAFKKFGENPQNMSWMEFWKITEEIFQDAAEGEKTWENYFGEEEEEREEKPVKESIAPAQKSVENKGKSSERETAKVEKEEEKAEEKNEIPEEKERLNQPEEEYEDPHPEGITSICYSCVNYEKCNVKTGTCTKCDQYKNRAEAYKSDEQRYSEEQDAIDRETKRKLKERADEEKMDTLPSDRKDAGPRVHEVKLARMFYDDVKRGKKTFELRKNDRGYKEGDILEMREYSAGAETGRKIRARITYILEDYTGLVEGYSILGIQVLPGEEKGKDDEKSV